MNPIAFCTPNHLELAHIYTALREDPNGPLDSPHWWSTVDRFGLGTKFRQDLDLLARLKAGENTPHKLEFLVQEGVAQMAVHLLPFFNNIVVKCGERGVIAFSKVPGTSLWSSQETNIRQRTVVLKTNSSEVIIVRHFPATSVPQITNVTGAGDTFVGALLSRLAMDPSAMESPGTMDRTIQTAQQAAALTLQSALAVSPKLSRHKRVE